MARTHLFSGNSKQNDENENDLLKRQKDALGLAKAEPAEPEAPVVAPVSPLPIPAASGSVLGADIVVTGSVASSERTEILGKINGNVSCDAELIVGGVITGDVTADVVQLVSGRIEGSVVCRQNISIDEASSVHGDVAGETILCGGKVEGNLIISQKTELENTAVVLGDISTKLITVDEGAAVEGRLKVSGPSAEITAKPVKAAEPEPVQQDDEAQLGIS